MSNSSEGIAIAGAGLFELIFSMTFPLLLVTLCGLSYVLAYGLHMPQFEFWAWAAGRAVALAKVNIWVMLGLVAFTIAALPLAWIAFQEHATRTSHMIGGWVGAGIFSAGTIWLAKAWAFDGSGLQEGVFAFLLLITWGGVLEALISTLKLAAQNRPQPGLEVVDTQKAHGDARVAGEAEAIALLNSKK